jgi:AbrB-like transcriptional regulator
MSKSSKVSGDSVIDTEMPVSIDTLTTAESALANRLTGAELLKKIAGTTGKRRDLAISCGYFKKVDGKVRVSASAFYEAVLAAKGIELSVAGSRGKVPGFTAKVSANGLTIGKYYLNQLKSLPELGSQFNIAIKGDKIILTMREPAEINIPSDD